MCMHSRHKSQTTLLSSGYMDHMLTSFRSVPEPPRCGWFASTPARFTDGMKMGARVEADDIRDVFFADSTWPWVSLHMMHALAPRAAIAMQSAEPCPCMRMAASERACSVTASRKDARLFREAPTRLTDDPQLFSRIVKVCAMIWLKTLTWEVRREYTYLGYNYPQPCGLQKYLLISGQQTGLP
ncbi:uncharacterized protein LAESUDRAFT_303324 [Laetiporus sulphureus 93-53]|uniref:Uncharacterized protein n=1 Tax=Laetiporus sulphureus 93-53 TaxID=1314785 RepID=A0A165D7N5_9APHY|nr:uncharacterized protein LAESUDRAFT_303324 [Laetiporus sulphureus 93-53]KZT04287.1 hypothetical protein LAESUDRAFT_303324 [Laetiporus sulphureus 93-53]